MPNQSPDYDVLVVGGGPAGASAALTLARAGRKVAVLDRAVFPRDKVCGDFLSPAARPVLSALGLAETLPELGACEVEKFILGIPGIEERHYSLPGNGLKDTGTALGLSRHRLDAFLLDSARRAGCDVYQGYEAVEIHREKDAECVTWRHTAKRGRTETWRAGHVVVAAGLQSGLGETRLARKRRSRALVGYKTYYSGPHPGGLRLYFFPGGYLGVTPVEEGRVNLCGVCLPGMVPAQGAWDRLMTDVGRRHPGFATWLAMSRREEKWWACSGLFHGRRALEGSGGLMAGEGSCFVEPVMGQGMTLAMAGGLVLGRLLAGGEAADEAGAQWEVLRKELYHDRLFWGGFFRRLAMSAGESAWWTRLRGPVDWMCCRFIRRLSRLRGWDEDLYRHSLALPVQ